MSSLDFNQLYLIVSRVSIPLVGSVLINWIRRRFCRYPYSPIPFCLAAKRLGVRARHFSTCGCPPSGHLRILLFLCRHQHIRTHTHKHIHTHIHQFVRPSTFPPSLRVCRSSFDVCLLFYSLLRDNVPEVARNLVLKIPVRIV